MSVKELCEKRNELAAEIRKMADKINGENRDFSAEERAAWDKVNADYNALTSRIEIVERAEKIQGEQRIPAGDPEIGREDRNTRPEDRQKPNEAPTDEDRAMAFQAWCRVQSDLDLSERHEDACRKLRFNPHRSSLTFHLGDTGFTRRLQEQYRSVHPSMAMRSLSAVTNPAGGYTVPSELVRSLEVNMLAFGGMMQVSEILRTDGGGQLAWPTADDTGNKGHIVGENVAVGTTTDPTFGAVTWQAYKYTSDAILVPSDLLADSAFDLASVVGAMLGERLSRILNTHFTTGDAASKPKGIITASTSGVTTASATAITADEILKLIHSVDPAYRTGASFMMHDSVLLALRLLKTGQGEYLWQSGVRDGVPDTLWGYPITVNQDMDSAVTTGKKTVLFGQLNKYKIRMVRDVRFFRLEERYRDSDQSGFVAFLRADGNLLNPGTQPVKYLTQA